MEKNKETFGKKERKKKLEKKLGAKLGKNWKKKSRLYRIPLLTSLIW